MLIWESLHNPTIPRGSSVLPGGTACRYLQLTGDWGYIRIRIYILPYSYQDLGQDLGQDLNQDQSCHLLLKHKGTVKAKAKDKDGLNMDKDKGGREVGPYYQIILPLLLIRTTTIMIIK